MACHEPPPGGRPARGRPIVRDGAERAGAGDVTGAGFLSVTVVTARWGTRPSGHEASAWQGSPRHQPHRLATAGSHNRPLTADARRPAAASPSGDDSECPPRASSLATGPEPKRPCNSWPWTGGSPDMRWVLRHPPARHPRSRSIRVHHLAGSAPPHARAAVHPPRYPQAPSVTLDLGSSP